MESRTFCATEDDLVFEEVRFDSQRGYVQTDDLAPPQSYYDVTGNQSIKRQAEGSISWSAILNPTKFNSFVKENADDPPTPPSHFNAYVLTWSRRSFGEKPLITQITNPPGKYGLGKANRLPELSHLSLKDSIPEESSIAPGDWVMIINLVPVPDYATFSGPQLALSHPVDGTRYRAEEAGYDKQLLFAKVTRVNRTGSHTITIDGGAFEIFPEQVARTATYLVHLPDGFIAYQAQGHHSVVHDQYRSTSQQPRLKFDRRHC